MRDGVKIGSAVRVLVGCAALIMAVGGCTPFGSNKGEVCADAKKVVQEYTDRLKEVAANDPAQWQQTTDHFAARFDALAKTSEDRALRTALSEQSAQLRAAAVKLKDGDVAALDKTLADTPDRLGGACN